MKKFIVVTVMIAWVGMIGSMALSKGGSDARVNLSFGKHISLKVIKGDSVDFGEIIPGNGVITKAKATQLEVKTNDKTDWTLSVSTKVEQGDVRVLEVFSVTPEQKEGTGNRTFNVDYAIDSNHPTAALLPAESYTLLVEYTASTK